MTKAYIEQFIKNMKQAGLVSKSAPWTYEGYGDKQKNIRYVGLAIKEEWLEVFSANDNLLLKFVSDRNSAFLEFYLANKPPFIKIYSTSLTEHDKWDAVLGELKRRLKKDKLDFTHHKESFGNLYQLIKPGLK